MKTMNQQTKSLYIAKFHLILTLFALLSILARGEVLVSPNFPKIEYLGANLESFGQQNQTFLNFNEGTWLKYNDPNEHDGRAYEFHPSESHYIGLKSVPKQFALLQESNMGLIFYENENTRIEPTMMNVLEDEELFETDFDEFLFYMEDKYNIDQSILDRLNKLPLVKVQDSEKPKVHLADQIMRKVESKVDPSSQKWTLKDYDFDIDFSLKTELGVSLIKGFMLMVYVKHSEAFFNPPNYIGQVDQELLKNADKIAENILKNNGAKIVHSKLMDEITELVKYFQKKGLIRYYYQSGRFLSDWLTSDEQVSLRSLTDEFQGSGFFKEDAFHPDIYMDLITEDNESVGLPGQVSADEAIQYRRDLLVSKVKELYEKHLDQIIENISTVTMEDKPNLELFSAMSNDKIFYATMGNVTKRWKKHAFGPFTNKVFICLLTQLDLFDNFTLEMMNDVPAASFLKKILFLNGLIPYDESLKNDVEEHDVEFFIHKDDLLLI